MNDSAEQLAQDISNEATALLRPLAVTWFNEDLRRISAEIVDRSKTFEQIKSEEADERVGLFL